MRVLLGVLGVTCLLLAGCAHEDRAGPDDYRLTGTLTEGFDDGDRQDLEQRVGNRGADISYMETFPVQFDIRPLQRSQCENLRLELGQVDYVQGLGDCQVLV